jgi:hypothetical protein
MSYNIWLIRQPLFALDISTTMQKYATHIDIEEIPAIQFANVQEI